MNRFSRLGVGNTPSLLGNSPSVVDRLRRVLLRALERGEEVRLVLDDRAAERSAVLVAAVVLLVDLVQLLGLASSRSWLLSRSDVNQLPLTLFVPLLVTMFITPPLLRPYSAL